MGVPWGRRQGWPLLAVAGLIALSVLTVVAAKVVSRPPARHYRVGYASHPPYLTVTPGGDPDGFAVAVFNEAARRRGVAVEWVHTPQGPDSALASGAIDFYPMLAVTQARQRSLALSPPWWQENFGLFARQGRTIGRTDLADGSTRVAVVEGAFGAAAFRDAFPRAAIVPFRDRALAVEAVCRGKADASVGEMRTLQVIRDRAPACAGVPLDFRWYRELNLTYAIAAQPSLAGEATAFEREIMALALDGTMAWVGERWGVQATNQLTLFRDLVAVRDRNFLLACAVSALTAIVGFAFWQFLRARQARHAAEQASLAKNQFLANISHEIRTPLNGILGMTELLMGTTLARNQREFVEALDESGRALLAIISDILDFSKIEAGKLTLEDQDVDVRQLVDQVVTVFAGRAAEKGLDIGALVAPDVPRAARGDAGRLRQVLSNITGNAVKFTDAGAIFVGVVRLGEAQPGTVRLRVTIEDSGVGVPDSLRARLFKPFSQIDPSARRRHGGTGLGLAISRQLVKLMDGDIGIEAVPTGGTRFWFDVVLRVEAPAVPVATIAALEGVPALVATARPVTGRVAADLLRSWGASVTRVETLAEAVAFVDAAAARTLAVVDGLLLEPTDPYEPNPLRQRMTDWGWPIVVLQPVPGPGPRAALDAEPGARTVMWPLRARGLRLAALDALQATPRAEEPRTATADHERLAARVLVADDNAINQKVVLSLLRRLGCEAVIVSNGREALEAARRSLATPIGNEPPPEPFDLVLMDCQMPEMDGIEATRAIRRLGGAETLPIIALTATSLREQWADCEAAGMNGLLSKPCGLDTLRAEIERWTRPASPERAAEHVA